MATRFVSLERLTTFKDKIINLLNNKLNKSGDTMTGDLKVGSANIGTNGYIEGSWLKSTAVSNKGSNTGKVAVFDDSGWLYYRTPKQILEEAGGATTYRKTITTTTTWIKNSNYYVQQVNVNGITADDTPIIDITTSVSNFENELEAYSKIFKITTSANSISIYSSEAINIALTLQIKVVK